MTLPYGANHQRMMQKFIAAGYPPHIAAGFVGNAMMESTPSIDPTIVNPGEGALGAFQHRLSRRKQLEAMAAKNGSAVTDLDTQIAFALEELGGSYSKADARIRGAQTPEEAAALIDQHYEQSAQKHTPQRQNYARHVYNQYIGGAGAQTPDGPGPVEALPPSQAPAGPVASAGPGAAMGGTNPVIQSILDQVAAEDSDIMGASMHAAAPASATDLMQEEDKMPIGSRVALGVGALGEALSAWSGKRPMDLEFLERIPASRNKRKQEVNQREAFIHLMNEQGYNDIAESLVNGLSIDDARTAYEARLAADKPSSEMRRLQDARKLVEEGRVEEAELLLSGMGESKPNAIQIAEWLNDPSVDQSTKEAYVETNLTPDRARYLKSLGAETPEDMIALELRLRQSSAARTVNEINLGEDASSKGAEAYGALQAKRLDKFHADAALAEQRMQDISVMSHLMDTGMKTGRLHALLMPFKGYLQDLGIEFEGLAEQQSYESIQQGMLPKLMSDIKGAASDFESKALLNAIPSVQKEEVANRILIQTLAAKNQQEMDKALFMEEYMVNNNYSLSGADREWRGRKKEYQVFKQFPTRAAAARAIAAGEIDPNEVIIVGDGKNASDAQIYLGRHLGL